MDKNTKIHGGNMKKDLYAILSGIFCASLIISNILAFKTFTLGEIVLPTAVIMFPIVYIVNDVLAEVYGFEKTKKIIFTGFAMNLIAVIAYNIAILLPAPVFFEGSDAFALVLSNSLRVLIASMSAYLVGSISNAKVMQLLKIKQGEKGLMARCVLSTLVGESLDALIFISIAFFGTMDTMSLITMIISQALFKTIYEIVFFPVTKRIIGKVKSEWKASAY